MNLETKLGLFVLAGITCLVVTIMMLGDFQFQKTYKLYVLYDNIAGLPNRAKVKMSGVEVGGVKEITLQDNKAKVQIWLDPKVQLHADAQAKIISTGIIGSKYMELTSGSSEKILLKDGDTIIGVNPFSFDQIVQDAMGQLSSLVKSFKGLEGADAGGDIAKTLSNLRKITDSLRVAISDNGNRVSDIVGNVEGITTDLAEVTRDSKADLKGAIREIKNVSEKLSKLLDSVDKTESTIGRLMNDKEMGTDLKETFSDLKETTREAKKALKRVNLIETSWDYSLRYDADYNVTKNDVGLVLRPKEDKFYYLGASNAGDSDSIDPAKEKGNTLNLLLGKKWNNVLLYGGVIRSKGGIGARIQPFYKWNPLKRVELTVEGYDFSRKAPVNKPKYNLGAKVQLNKWLYVGTQLEDPYHQSSMNSYVNLVVRDDDIAYILGLITLAK